jgi:hypothetical protein
MESNKYNPMLYLQEIDPVGCEIMNGEAVLGSTLWQQQLWKREVSPVLPTDSNSTSTNGVVHGQGTSVSF